MNGLMNYRSGLAAEEAVAKNYSSRGLSVARKRWRGRSGEIDLIAREGKGVVFIEVKKSRSFEAAAARVSKTQMQRIYRSASEFLAGEPSGQNTDVRFDVALVNGTGEVQVLENAFGHF